MFSLLTIITLGMEDPLNGSKYTLEIAHQGSSTLIGQSVGL